MPQRCREGEGEGGIRREEGGMGGTIPCNILVCN